MKGRSACNCENSFCPDVTEELRAENAKLFAALQDIVDSQPHNGGPGACFWCDMSGSGYSSKGDGNHDDVKYVCPVAKAKEAFAACDTDSRIKSELCAAAHKTEKKA